MTLVRGPFIFRWACNRLRFLYLSSLLQDSTGQFFPASRLAADRLDADMFVAEPPNPKATLIWLVGLGDTHQKARSMFELLKLPNVRVVVPNPPRLPITALEEALERSWFDVASQRYAEGQEDDLRGIGKSMTRLHALVADEAELLAERFAGPAPAAAPAPATATAPSPEGSADQVRVQQQQRQWLAQGARRIILGGFGQGGALALHSAVRFPLRLGGIVSFSGYFPFVEETAAAAQVAAVAAPAPTATARAAVPGSGATAGSADAPASPPPSKRSVNLSIPVLAVHGRADAAIPFDFAAARYARARAPPLQMPITLRANQEMGHFMSDSELFGMQQWVTALADHIDKAATSKVAPGAGAKPQPKATP